MLEDDNRRKEEGEKVRSGFVGWSSCFSVSWHGIAIYTFIVSCRQW